MTKSLGDILLEKGYIDQQGLNRALTYQMRKVLGEDFHADWASNLLIDIARKKYNKRDEYYLGKILTELKLLPETKILEALAIQKASPSEKPRDRLEALNEIITRINSSYSLIDLLNQILVQAARLVGAESASLIIYDHGKDTLVILMPSGPTAEAVRDLEIPNNKGIAGWVYQNSRSAICNDTAADPRYYPAIDETSGYMSRQILCVPLMVKNKRLGALEVINSTRGTARFTAVDQLLLEMLSAGAAIAIENTRLTLSLSHLEEELPLATERAALAGRMRVASVVMDSFRHELESSFIPMKGYAEMLREISADERIEKYRSYIEREMERLISRADDILCFMKEDCPAAHLPVDLAELLKAFEVETWVECRLFGITLEISMEDGLSIIGDRDLLMKCLRNLLRNSREAMSEGGEICIEARRRDAESLAIVVRDNGPGLKCDPIERIFEPFFAPGKPHAAGLGLSITKRIIAAHGGSIAAENAAKGAVFSIILPIN